MPPACAMRDRERAFGHRVHRRRDQRDAELDLAGEARSRVGVAGQDRGGRRDQHDVVEGERLPDFHAASSSDGGALYTSAPRSKAMGKDIGAAPRLCAPAEALGDDIDLGRFGAARRRLGVAQLGEDRASGGRAIRPRRRPERPWRRRRRRARARCAAKSKAASASATMRRWSVAAWPVAGAAMSVSTTSAPPPSAARSPPPPRGRGNRARSNAAPAIGAIRRGRRRRTRPRGADALDRDLASSRPGAQPRSTTRRPGRSR